MTDHQQTNNSSNTSRDTKCFKFVDEFNISFAQNDRIVRYRHVESNMMLILHHCPGPKVNASIIVPTEAPNNRGLPHTLEHLVFNGCDSYPYRDFIESVANRCFSSPSNAYTAEDHTCYSVESVGPEGLIHYLPVLLRFVLRPTLKDSDFTTEIYHIDATGQESGVVMCEMQSRENTCEDLSDFHITRALYPNSYYANSYGGAVREIAKLTNAEIREYHGKYYHPDIITIIVQGCIDEPALLDKLDQTEIVASPFYKEIDGGEQSRVMPWLSELPPMTESSSQKIRFPCEDESVGSVTIGWRGPSVHDNETLAALGILIRYLNAISSSPLPQHFVHGKHAYASNVSITIQELKESKLLLEFSGVNVYNHENQDSKEKEEEEEEDDDEEDEDEDQDDEELEELEKEENNENGNGNNTSVLDEGTDDLDLLNEYSMYNRVVKVFEDIKKNGFNKEDMLFEIEKELIKILEGYEEDPLGFVSGSLLTTVVFPPKDATTFEEAISMTKDIESKLNYVQYIEALKDKDSQFWCDLLDTWFLNAPHAEVLMIPSAELAAELSQSTLDRVKQRCDTLGAEGLARLDTELKAAIEANKPYPESFRSKLPPIPDIKKIKFDEPKTVTMPPNSSDNPTGFTIQDVIINTQFIQSTWFFHVKDLPLALKPYLTILSHLVFESNVNDTERNIVIPFKEVVTKISRETISLDCGMGLSGATFSAFYGELFRIAGSSTVENFGRLIYWIVHGFLCIQVNANLLKTVVVNLIKSLKETSRDPSCICNAHHESLLTRDIPTSNNHAISIYRQKHFLHQVLDEINSGDIQTTIDALTGIRNYIDLPTNNKISPFEISAAVSTSVYDFYSVKSTASEMACEAYTSLFRGLKSISEQVDYLDRISKVSTEDLQQFLQSESNFIIMATNPSSEAVILQDMKSTFNYEFKSIDLNSLFNKD
ncbi:hypothetical protein PPL_04227 [Heterostelium album PN500]|uniref:Uncharacterized protein n=1 Tax=Heterostelium pallidum (strain ATCC 26659 / Pp 5 / PN500) TaxID=670386 RepID=D3B6Z6_HETP5|nr:hypothetical protein PPL_04227 [Heterostelium album PN500]EFA82539.1 hypothetical protein PPL_04227 [Heterostelium album PN500]|eukprot:XP_020434656.1 hypothetical protein PPL_04227 [Heterostelium album PN500]